jgi:sigma-E factor negative regulatory protein RseA
MASTQQLNVNPQEQISRLLDGQLTGEAFASAVQLACDDTDARATWHAYHVVGDVLRSSELAAHVDNGAFLARFQARMQQEGLAGPRAQTVGLSAVVGAVVGVGPDRVNAVAVATPPVQSVTTDFIAIKQANTGAIDAFVPNVGAANESIFRWKMLAGFASLVATVAVVAVGWQMVAGQTGDVQQISRAPVGTVPVSATMSAPAGLTLAPSTSADNGLQLSTAMVAGQPQVMIRDPNLDALLAAHKQFGGTSALQNPAGFLRSATYEGSSR